MTIGGLLGVPVVSERRFRSVLALSSFGTLLLYAVFQSYSQSDDVEIDSGGWETSVRPRRLLTGPLLRGYEGAHGEEWFNPDTIPVSSRLHSKRISNYQLQVLKCILVARLHST